MSNRIAGKSNVLLVKVSLVSLLTENPRDHDTYETRYGVPIIIIELEELDDRGLGL
jgi:hypothetical protein